MTWYVQPLALEPFTRIRNNSTWHNTTHPGSEYAALLINPGFKPPLRALQLPTDGVVALARTQAWPPVWQSWWFPLVCVAIAAALTLALYRVWTFQVTRKLNRRFEERLAERTRVAQELHDTLLQGVLSASMQLHVAVDQLPQSSPVRPALNRVLELMGHVVDEVAGSDAVHAVIDGVAVDAQFAGGFGDRLGGHDGDERLQDLPVRVLHRFDHIRP